MFIIDDTEAELAEKPRRCRDRVCDTVCRALNNTSGTCVDGRCKCTKSVAAEGYRKFLIVFVIFFWELPSLESIGYKA